MNNDYNQKNQTRDAMYKPTAVWQKLINTLFFKKKSPVQKQASSENSSNYSKSIAPETKSPTAAELPESEKAHAPEHAHDLVSVVQRLAAIETHLSSLQNLFEQRLRYDEQKEQAFNKLYEKMRQQEGDYQASLKKSLVLSLLLLYDNMQKVETALGEQPDVQKYVTSLRQELIDILYAEDVEPMGNLGDVFDHHRQQAINTVPTNDLRQDKTVERIVREGFFHGSAKKVLRPQSVTIRKYQNSSIQNK